MKNKFYILLLVILSSFSQVAYCQFGLDFQPTDSLIKIGRLDNGMMYYLQNNPKSKGLANFYIVHNVGAMQEDSIQNGLAHFLEHMAFNGTENLPGKMMLEYFQSIGVKFGADINASTGQDNTKYMIKNVPIYRQGVIDTALLVMKDWSGGVSLLDAEIDNERGVILEEIRTNNTLSRRMNAGVLKYLYNGTKYYTHDVFGPEENIQNFKYQTIKDFYHKWYRPNLQAIVVTGDIDVDKMESDIIRILGSIPATTETEKKKIVVIPSFKEEVAGVVTDKENKTSSALIVSVSQAAPYLIRDTEKYGMIMLARNIVSTIMTERYKDIAKGIDAPFLTATFGAQEYTAYNEMVACQVTTQNGKLAIGVEAAMKEVNRLFKYGVTEDEVERVIINFKSAIKESYDNRFHVTNDDLAQVLISKFVNGTSAMSPEDEYKFYTKLLDKYDAELLTKMLTAMFPIKNMAVVGMTPDDAKFIPSEEELLNAYLTGKTATVEPPKGDKVDRQLIVNEPKSVSIKKEYTDELGSKVWELKNGATVIIKPTEFVSNQIVLKANGYGGLNMISDDKLISANLLETMLGVAGLGKFNSSDLTKALTGKSVRFNRTISSYTHDLSGVSIKEDIETLMQLIHLSYTDQRLGQEEFDYLIRNYKNKIHGIEDTPSYKFNKESNKIKYGENYRLRTTDNTTIEEVNLEDMQYAYDKLFDGVGGMTFIFIGTIDEEKIKPLVEKYIASLPKGKKKHTKTTGVNPLKGKINRYLPIEQESPKTSYTAYLHSDDIKEVAISDNLKSKLFEEVLTARYTKSIREEMGATYGVKCDVGITRIPTKRLSLSIKFDTNEEKLYDAQPEVLRQIKLIADGDDVSKEMEVARTNIAKNYMKSINTSNNLWASIIMNYHLYGEDMAKDYLKQLSEITSQDINDMAKKLIDGGNIIEITMFPK